MLTRQSLYHRTWFSPFTPFTNNFITPNHYEQHHAQAHTIGFEFRSGSPSSCRALSSGLSTAQRLCTSPTASTAQLTSPWGEACVPANQRWSLFPWLVAAWSGIALSQLMLPAHGTAYHRLSRYCRHYRLLSIIWRHICSQHPTSDADSSSPNFLLAKHVNF